MITQYKPVAEGERGVGIWYMRRRRRGRSNGSAKLI
jgi:hypothetical protein